jgi:hypothetical protein
MNTIHRVGLMIAGVVAVMIMAGAFVVQGYTSAHHEAATAGATQVTTARVTPSPTATVDVTLEPQTIYVAPVPTPAVIRIVKKAPPRPAITVPKPAATPTPTGTPAPSYGGGDDGPGDGPGDH